MDHMKKVCILFFLALVFGSRAAYAGLGDLMQLGRNMQDVKESYDQETKNYEAAAKALDKGVLVKGQSKAEIQKICGEPVIMLQEMGTGRGKWYYKRASESFFGGERIILFFDKSGSLDETRVDRKKY